MRIRVVWPTSKNKGRPIICIFQINEVLCRHCCLGCRTVKGWPYPTGLPLIYVGQAQRGSKPWKGRPVASSEKKQIFNFHMKQMVIFLMFFFVIKYSQTTNKRPLFFSSYFTCFTYPNSILLCNHNQQTHHANPNPITFGPLFFFFFLGHSGFLVPRIIKMQISRSM